MEVDVDAATDMSESGATLIRNGVLTAAGRDEVRSNRALPPPPTERMAMEWDISRQKHRGKHASCRACYSEFASDELRFARSSDSRAGSSRYLHATCLPGGFHPQDTFTGTVASEQEAIDLVASCRGTEELEDMQMSQDILPHLPAFGGLVGAVAMGCSLPDHVWDLD